MLCRFVASILCRAWFVVFFFKQKTAYEMRISDWSSDVCSTTLCRCRNAPPFSFFRQRPRGGAKAALLPQSPEALENRGDVGRLPSDVHAKRVQSLHLREFRRDQGPYQADRGRARGETNFLILIAVKDIISTRMALDRDRKSTRM